MNLSVTVSNARDVLHFIARFMCRGIGRGNSSLRYRLYESKEVSMVRAGYTCGDHMHPVVTSLKVAAIDSFLPKRINTVC